MMNIARTSHPSVLRTVAIAILIVMVLPPFLPTRGVVVANGEVDISAATEQIFLLVGRSTIIRTDRPIARVSISTPDIADAMVTAPRELLVHGKTPGTISLLVWNDNGRITSYEVAVRRDFSPLDAQIKRQFPDEQISVASNGKDVVLSGIVSTKFVIDRASSLAVGYVDKAENVVNLLRQQESTLTNQVMLKVRFAEVSRQAMQELGASFFTGAAGKGDWIARGTTQQYAAPTFDQDKGLVFSDFLNLFAFNTEEQLGVVVKALKNRGLFESLAEPNLITQDGVEASFLAGGEFPYPIVQGGGANSSVTIMFKEFGVRLKFTPTITAGDMVHLKVAPEVSTLDFSNAVTLQGFNVPAIATRRTETQVELRDGQTFAIAGLLDRNVNETLAKVPGIGDIPILGYLFRSQKYKKNHTELVVMITPHIVRRGESGVTPNLPALEQPFLSVPKKNVPQPPPAFSNPTSGQDQAAPARSVVSNAPASKTSVAAVARPVPAAVDAAVESVVAHESATQDVRVNDNERRAADKAIKDLSRRQAALSQEQRKQDTAAQRNAAVLARQEQEHARAAAKIEAARSAKEQQAASRQAVIDAERQRREQKISEKRAAEQAIVDRKRWIEQQQQAAEAKEAADKLAREQEKIKKEQDRLAKEQAARQSELARLVSQYRKLTEAQTTQPSQ
jgi:pilus assembly protein CpaC